MADVTEKLTENVEEETVNTVENEKSTDTEKSNGTKTSDDAAEAEANGAAENKTTTTVGSKNPGFSVEDRIRRQVEYYFGDVNLCRDKFLLEQIQKNEDGWVPIDVLMTFKRLEALSKDADVIVNALLTSEEGVFEISEDRKQIRRHPERPMPEANEERRRELIHRTIYVRGFPLDSEMNDLLDYFETFEKVQNLTLRKYYDKSDSKYKFKGSVLVSFETIELAGKFLELPEIRYKGIPLECKWQQVYNREKCEGRKKNKKKKGSKKHDDKKEIVLNKGTVLHFEGITDNTKRELIREAVEKIDNESKIAYIDFQQGQKEGKIRFHDEGQAVKFLEKLQDKKLPIKEGLELTLRALSGEEEDEFLKQVVHNMKNIRNRGMKTGKTNVRKRRGFFGGKQGKKQKLEKDE